MLKRNFLFVFFLIFLILIIVFGFYITKSSKNNLLSPQQTSWQEIIPGKTSVDEVTKKLGQPESVQQKDNFSVFLYPSKNQYWKNELEASQNTVFFIKERVFDEDTILSNKIKMLKTVPTHLYGDASDSGFTLLVYPQEGIAFVTQEQQNRIIEIWYFPKTTLEGFLQYPQAKGYSINKELSPEEF